MNVSVVALSVMSERNLSSCGVYFELCSLVGTQYTFHESISTHFNADSALYI